MPTNDASDKGRALAALRLRQTATCVICGRKWQALVRPNQPASTCSNACRQAAWRKRKKPAE